VLKLLEQSQLVVQDVFNRRYYLGPLITRLASNPVTTHEYLIMYSNEEMKRLSQISEETVTLDIMIGLKYYSLCEIASKHDLKVTQDNRQPGPIHAGASGKVLMAQLNDRQLKAAMESLDFGRVTERTVANKELLAAQIKEIRRQGHCVSYGERIPGGLCISVPVRDYMLPVVLSAVGPESRLQAKAQIVLEEMKKSAARISKNIKAISGKRGVK
jgi:DNA-binding IclR family transcriptional regulator